MCLAGKNALALEPNGEGVYEIGSAADLVAFAYIVNGYEDGAETVPGNYAANAVLTADIDMSTIDSTELVAFPIGGSANAERYVGTFDGQGHKISNLHLYNPDANPYGLFITGPNVVLMNFWLDSSCSIRGGELVGLVGRHDAGAATLINVGNGGDVTGNNNNVAGLIGGTWGKDSNGTVQTVTIKNCWTTGRILTTETGVSNHVDCGAISGWFNNVKVVLENCWTTAEVVHPRAQNMYVFRNGAGASFTYKNCYSLNGEQPNFTKLSGLSPADAKNPATGAITYALNGDQSDIIWYQTIGTDPFPVTDDTHGVVYLNGHIHCDGSLYESGSTYENENKGIVQDEHEYVDGFCTFCKAADAEFCKENADGYYEIGSETQLVWFAAMVKSGKPGLNAILTDDIVMTKDWTLPIGTPEVIYTGSFDGQGHAITGFNMTATTLNAGLFGTATNANIGNFSISGKLVCAGAGNGVIGKATNCTIYDIQSSLEIDASRSGVTHTGGIVGEAFDNTIVNKCAYNGTLNAGNSNHDCFGGVCGYTNTGTFNDCINNGTVLFGNIDCYAGGVLGYLNNANSHGLHSCLNLGNVIYAGDGEPTYGGALVGRLNTHTASYFGNSYWLEGSASCGTGQNKLAKAISVTEEELSNGSITWKLNGESFIDVTWYQNIDTDDSPSLDPSKGIVYKTGDVYAYVLEEDPSTYYSFRAYVIDDELTFADQVAAYQPIVDEYITTVESWEEIMSFEEFCEAYQSAMELKESIKNSVEAYQKYAVACEQAAVYLAEHHFKGEMRSFLESYLSETMEPGDYPHGSYLYIMAKKELTDEDLADEINYVNHLLESAIAEDITPGAEITRLLKNPTFGEGFEGWTTSYVGGSITVGGAQDLMPIPRGLNNNSFDMHQTITELPNGIYMVSMNGLFRAGNDVYNDFYAGQLYLNGTSNYFMSPGGDVIGIEAAEDSVNCILASDVNYIYEEIEGYVPGGMVGCSYAYSAGRYQNYCAVEVKDSTLTVGVRNLGTGLSNDWLPFGNVRVYYLGTAEEAASALSAVLEGYVQRANTILSYIWLYDADYYMFPNMSEELKGELETAIESVSDQLTGAQKMELIEKFSSLFDEVYACRKAYIELASAAENMDKYLTAFLNAKLISQQEYDEWAPKFILAWEAYQNGSLSTEEALAMADELNTPDLFLPSEKGVYQLSTLNHLVTFSTLVASGINNSKAVLTADLDFSELPDTIEYVPIGTSSFPFMGTFDGQNHKITGFNQTYSKGKEGLFGTIREATIKNLYFDGTITLPGGGTGYGMIGWSEAGIISNVHSTLKIAITGGDVHHVGGIAGSFRAISNTSGSKAYGCSFSGTITESAGNNDCFGSIAGYSNEYCYYENCANYGTLTFTNPNCYAGGIFGYINNELFSGIQNCLNVGDVQMNGGVPTNSGAIIGCLRNHTASYFGKNYWLEGSAVQSSGERVMPEGSAIAVTSDQLASGEICYALNEGQEEPVWFQTLGVDPYPVLDPTHLKVIKDEDGTYKNEGGTGIEMVQGAKSNSQGLGMGLYDLQGRRLNAIPTKGMYILNGQKFLVK